uniref:MJ1316 RNA cyclic group end recognition domain-containing protein n=1 Tax=Chromera velia CCMP2878 TaxID=1169474 RepID=A0A0G4HWZ5_9ALVE|eukprot:Cvel_1453.t1-p1 / transcript=Cvel_1453.t1 / gene=Cvel_1453 / organism=Chromera_velia_CCMP2878 / gene_product=Leukocyte receptor cluster member 9, putative / transcript_product=Leukocyte receptor cluster member 9, putative / location=Cvel_scaffold51:25736-32003(+) / protein_length=1175 / sequence_SO=supercontig / SO=protein_coding / is_pseudo=false
MSQECPPPSTQLDVGCALVVVVPRDSGCFRAIQEIRKKHDERFQRWPPHITLLFPFVERKVFGDAVRSLSAVLKDIPPFEASFKGLACFDHGTFFLDPDERTTALLTDICDRALSLFPSCKSHEKGFRPHLTLGTLDDAKKADAFLQMVSVEMEMEKMPVKFEVTELNVMYRLEKAGRYRSEWKIPLGSGIGDRGAEALPLSVHGHLPLPRIVPFRPDLECLPDTASCFRFDPSSDSWVAVGNLSAGVSRFGFCVASLNVMAEIHDSFNEWRSGERFRCLPRVLEALEPSPDVICLQEVTPTALTFLTADPFIRKSFFLSDSPQEALTVQKNGCGQVTLSKVPFRNFTAVLSGSRVGVLSLFPLSGGTQTGAASDSVLISNVHLTATSDRQSAIAAQARALELKRVLEAMDRLADTPDVGTVTARMVIGDMNSGDVLDFRGDRRERPFPLPPGFVDAGIDGWPTHIPSENALAAAQSKSGSDCRLDRILLSCQNGKGSARAVRFGLDPLPPSYTREVLVERRGGVSEDPLWVSDHAGLLAVVVLPSNEEGEGAEGGGAIKEGQVSVEEEGAAGLSPSAASVLFCPHQAESFVRLRLLLLLSGAPLDLVSVGSSGLALAGERDDLDALVKPLEGQRGGLWSRSEIQKVAEEVLSTAQERGAVSALRAILDSALPLLDFKLHRPGAGGPLSVPTQLVWSSGSPYDRLDLRSESAERDNAEAIAALTAGGASFALFRQVAADVRRWARRRCVYSLRAGFPGGAGWSFLVARAICLGDSDIAAVLRRYANAQLWRNEHADWVREMGEAEAQAPLVVPTYTAPRRNLAHCSTHSSMSRLLSELLRASRLIDRSEDAEEEEGTQENIQTGPEENAKEETEAEAAESSAAAPVAAAAPDVVPDEEKEKGTDKEEGKEEEKGESSPELQTKKETIARKRYDDMWKFEGPGWVLSLCAPEDDAHAKGFLGSRVPAATLAMEKTIGGRAVVSVWQSEGGGEGGSSKDDWLFGVSRALSEDDRERIAVSAHEAVRNGWIKLRGALGIPHFGCEWGFVPAGHAYEEHGDAEGIEGAEGEEGGGEEGNAEKKEAPLDQRFIRDRREEGGKKQKLRESSEVYQRVRWDASLDPSEWTLTYEDRFKGMLEVPLGEFDTETIPWHRVYVFKKKGVVMWDRKARYDALFTYQ